MLVALLLFSTLVSGSNILYTGRKYVYEGDTFNLTCIRTAYGFPKWSKDGVVVVPDDGNVTISEEVLESKLFAMHLHVAAVAYSHRGEYKCDTFDKNSHRLEVVPQSDPIDGEWSHARQTLQLNETLKLHCLDVEDSVFQINWYKDGHRIIEGADERISMRSRDLRIAMAIETDTGEYRCATEVAGLSYPAVKHLTYVIEVTYAAQVEVFPPQLRPILGRNFELECKVRGFPIPRISWYIDDVPIEIFHLNNTRFGFTENDEGMPNAIFYIINATYEDEHIITCIAENVDGFAKTSVVLAVRANMINTNEDYPGKGLILNVGSDLVLQCNITDDPLLNVVWQKNGNNLNMSDSRISVENFNNTLVIRNPTEGDTGSYSCIINSEEKRDNATIVVRTKVRLQQFDSSRNVIQGQDFILNCTVTQGIPLPTLQWFKDGELLNLSDSRIESEENKGILKIKDAEFGDRADYMCLATNAISSANTTVLVRIKDKYAALWPFLGICAEVAILCTIIFVYEKKRQKPDFDESEADHTTENKNVVDQEDKSQDIRQRK